MTVSDAISSHPTRREIAHGPDAATGYDSRRHNPGEVIIGDYTVTHLEQIDEIADGRCPFRPIRHELGIESFGISSWTGHSAGDRIINEHDESESGDRQEELYLVHTGRATFELDGQRVDAPAGTFVLARPGVKRTAFAEEPGTTVIALGGTPGRPYQALGWELWAPLGHFYGEGRYAEAADRGGELIDQHPGYPNLIYNVACCESLAGRGDDALAHLRESIDQAEMFRELAARDSDFDAIRDRPEFQQLVGGG